MKKKLFFTYISIILILSGLIGFYSIQVSQKFYYDDYKEHLFKESNLLANILSEYNISSNNEKVSKFVDENAKLLNLRISIIDNSGTVIKDSDIDAKILGNHSDRAEVMAAINGETGFAKRYSDSLGMNLIYSAVPVKTIDGEYVLRMAIPLMKFESIKEQMMLYILAGIFVSSVLSIIYAFYIAKRITEPLEILTEAADEIKNGRYGKVIHLENDSEFGVLTKAFNKMSLELDSTITRLENENAKLEAVVNSMLNGVIAVDNNDNIMLMNNICYKLLNIKSEKINGQNFYNIVKNKSVVSIYKHSVEDKFHGFDEVRINSKLDGNKILRVYTNTIYSSGDSREFLGSLIVFQDVTQIRKLEKLRSDFVSNVTHELKTPLTSIMGFTDTLKAGALNDPVAARRFTDIIDIEAKRLFVLIQDILYLSEIETRNEDTDIYPEDLKIILKNTCDMLALQADSKNLTLTLDIDENLPLFNCNSNHISQVFVNLIDNAIKYTENGRIDVMCIEENGFIKFSVKDTGIGIPDESCERVFERFYRVDKGRSRKVGGTGLGLSIVKHVVLLYGGRLAVKSEIGKGTIFTVYLPIKK